MKKLQNYKKKLLKIDLLLSRIFESVLYRPFHKTLPRSSLFVNWISLRFYETYCIRKQIIFQYAIMTVNAYFEFHVKKWF